MNDKKLKRLFEAARSETPLQPPENFDANVLRALRHESRSAGAFSFWEQLESLFPKLTVASLLLVGMCILGDYFYSVEHPAGLAGDISEVTEQYLFASNSN